MDVVSKQEHPSSDSSLGEDWSEELTELTTEQHKRIFDLHVLSSETRGDLKLEEGIEEVDVRMDHLPWVNEMKATLANYERPLLPHLYKEFEQLKTVEIAVYLGQLCRYNGRKYKGGPCEEKAVRWASQGFAASLYSLIVHDKEMRKYLAYRGLRSRINSIGEWGTVIYTWDRPEGEKGAGWRWLADTDLDNFICVNVIHYSRTFPRGQEGTYYSTYNAKEHTKDMDGTGASSLENEKVNPKKTKCILSAGNM